MHASTTPMVRRVAATSALALVALSGAAGTAVAAPGNQGKHGHHSRGNGSSSNNAAPEADRHQGKAKATGHDKGAKPSGGQGPLGGPGSGASGSPGPSGDSGSDGTTGSVPGGSGAKGSPPGNNGTVKIAPLGEMDGIPNNSPHPGCDFQVEWYGFDEATDVVSRVSFAMQAPTGDVGLTVNGPSEVFVGEDPASGAGQDPDGVKAYQLSFDGAPHPQQGYHVKLTVNTPRSNGADVKHKVFWVEACEGSSSVAPQGGAESGSFGGPSDGSESGSLGGSESGSLDGSASGSGEVAGSSDGTASRTGVSADVTTSGESDTPTSVDAGATGSDIARGSLIGLLVAAAGGALLWYARRTRAHG